MIDLEVLPDVVPSNNVSLYCPPYLSSADVAEVTGIPGWRLGRWVGQGWITPVVNSNGSGTARLWHPSVINEIVAIREAIDRCPYGHNEHE